MKKRSLAETQREFFSTLVLPLRGRSRRQTELPASEEAHSDYFFEVAERQIKPSPKLIPAECLELYHRQYWFRILDSIEEDFSELTRLLGKERFFEFVEGYLLERGSKSYTLRHLGADFAKYLARNISENPLRARAVAVAEIEYGQMAAFEAKNLPAASPEDVTSRPFTLQPSVLLFSQEANAAAWMDGAEWEEGEFFAAVWRSEAGALQYRELASGEYAMLKRLQGRETDLDDWLNESAEEIEDMAELSRWFTEWRVAGWFALPE